MIVFNRTIFNIYEAKSAKTESGFINYTKGKCVDVLFPDEPRSYNQIIGDLATKLLNIGGPLWIENEIGEYTGSNEGQLIKVPVKPEDKRVYDSVCDQVREYLRRMSIEYAFWLIENSKIKASHMTILALDCDGHINSSLITTIPDITETKFLPSWFVDLQRNYVSKVDRKLEVNAFIGYEPNITQKGGALIFPSRPSHINLNLNILKVPRKEKRSNELVTNFSNTR